MKNCTPALLASLLMIGGVAQAQTKAQGTKNPASKASPKAKESAEAEFARKTLGEVLDTVNKEWFGKAYQDVRCVELEGRLSINFTADAANAKVDQLAQGAVKGGLTKGGTVEMEMKATSFANGDHRTELKGAFGSVLDYRSGEKGFRYSKELNAYTTKVDPSPANPPVTYLGYFSECVNEIRDVYVKGTLFRASMGREDANGNQIIVFNAPTGTYDPKKREQSMTESLGFWKRGKLEVIFDKSTRQPQRMSYYNEAQGISSHMTFSYAGNRPTSVTIDNQSKGMEGPASVTLAYNGQGRIDHLSGQMGFPAGTLRFDLSMAWSSDRKPTSIATIPPLGATKKGGDELETMLLVNLAGKVLDLQKGGFNLRSVTLTDK